MISRSVSWGWCIGGGLEALERLFNAMPADTEMAFVVVQHLSSDFKSLMVELLARWTSMPIYSAQNEMPVKSNAVYLMPPKKVLINSDGKLLLIDKGLPGELSLPIDQFFRSLDTPARMLERSCFREPGQVVRAALLTSTRLQTTTSRRAIRLIVFDLEIQPQVTSQPALDFLTAVYTRPDVDEFQSLVD